MKDYLDNIFHILTDIEDTQADVIRQAQEMAAKVIQEDGLIHIFGCGHSHIPGLDSFYRAGGLANVSAMLDTDLMLHNGAAKSSRMEKMPGIGQEIFRRYKVEQKDMVIIFSASGKNQVPCDVVDAAKEAGVNTVGVSSSSYFEKGGKLHNHTALHIDCRIPYGDASVDVGEGKMGGLSTYAFCYIVNSILIGGARLAQSRGFQPPIYLSGNIEGGREHNILLEEKYLGRVKHL